MKRKLLILVASFLICGTLHAQDYHWSYNFHDYESNFPFIGEVYINGEAVASSDFEIAAFVGDQVRATEFLFEADPDNYPGRYYAWLGISYDNTDETVTFKLYDHSTGTEYDHCSTTVLTNADGYGETWDPVHVEFTAVTPVSYGPDYPWVVAGGFENYMYIEAQIQIDGVPVSNTSWEVGAFCGDECRGLGDADHWWVSPIDQSNILEIVVGGATGDVINFYLYDVTNTEVFHGICNATLDWIDGDIGDMFEPYVINFVSEQTFTKDILACTDNGGYYLIATPVGEVNPEAVTNMLENSYDLYYFDQTQELEWINYKTPNGINNNFGNLVSGKGYLYANSQAAQLNFTGVPYNGNGEVTLSKVEGKDFSGWNLVGNPFAQAAYITKDYYRMNPEGTDFVSTTAETAIQAMEGVFVVAETNGETLTFSTEGPAKRAALVMNISQDCGVIDRVIVRFDGGHGLEKLQFNPKHTKVYVTMEGKDYAVVNVGQQGELLVNFKAEKNGAYTLSFTSEEVTFSYLHLIDNLTGNDVDLLFNPSYSFEAKSTDYASRFRLVFR